jgi:hypothetical protein
MLSNETKSKLLGEQWDSLQQTIYKMYPSLTINDSVNIVAGVQIDTVNAESEDQFRDTLETMVLESARRFDHFASLFGKHQEYVTQFLFKLRNRADLTGLMSEDETLDLAGDVWAELLVCVDKWDPALCSETTFIGRVVINLFRNYRRKLMNRLSLMTKQPALNDRDGQQRGIEIRTNGDG